MGWQSWGGMDGLSVMGRYGWTVNHGEVQLDCQSWGGTAGLSIMGRYSWTVSHGEVRLDSIKGRCVCELLINSRKDVDMLFIVEGVDVLSTG